ncbi:Hpt domain-containing protein [Duganella sp. CF458]|uniref:Hpt domain-containing protein n=1 Tax=Duganella sp. CF458 TaxID=1884368 RepID=UPI0008EE2DEC|nr:Hpt domain-containing protein [Duganella sp. CF458]SFG82272.1 Hpt domain-containing protein [Duganella sp. CF458]
MATAADPDYHDRLQALRDKYAASVPERMAAIRNALVLCQGSLIPPHIEQLHHALHSVAGSAGSFGLAALGDEARRIEQMVRGVMEADAPWLGIEAATHALLQWADKDFGAGKIAAHD